MLKIAVTGANSFIGTHLLEKLSVLDLEINALCRNKFKSPNQYPNVHVFIGNLLERTTLENFIKGCDIVINLSYLWDSNSTQNLEAIKNLGELCVAYKIKRFIHCSTTSVYGTVSATSVDEDTPCKPQTEYAKTKLAIEHYLLDHYSHFFELLILRPTQVFGPRGKNLVKLATDLMEGSLLKNYLKSCFMSQKPMNLVCIDNVVGALEFLMNLKNPQKIIYIASDDEAEKNKFYQIENYLMNQLKTPDYFIPPLALPLVFYKQMYRMIGKGSINPNTIYHEKNLSDAGYIKSIAFEDGLAKFIRWYHKNSRPLSVKALN